MCIKLERAVSSEEGGSWKEWRSVWYNAYFILHTSTLSDSLTRKMPLCIVNSNCEGKKVSRILLFIFLFNTLTDSIEDIEKRLSHRSEYPHSDLKIELNTSGMVRLLLGRWLQEERKSRGERGRARQGERGVRGWEKGRISWWHLLRGWLPMLGYKMMRL